jgi:hypothetical protein
MKSVHNLFYYFVQSFKVSAALLVFVGALFMFKIKKAR